MNLLSMSFGFRAFIAIMNEKHRKQLMLHLGNKLWLIVLWFEASCNGANRVFHWLHLALKYLVAKEVDSSLRKRID